MFSTYANFKKETMTKKIYISTKEIAEYFVVSVTTIHDWRKAGCPYIKGFKQSGSRSGYGYSRAEVAEWVESKVDKRKKVENES